MKRFLRCAAAFSLALSAILIYTTTLSARTYAAEVKSKENRPSGLMTDLVKESDILYQRGYPVARQMWEVEAEQWKEYQFAAIRSSRPTFGWIVPHCGQNTYQRSYRIVVADNLADAEQHIGNVWDSGKVRSSQSVAVKYAGEELKPDKLYFWSVQLTTNRGSRSEWSEVKAFRTASQLSPYAASYSPQIRQRDVPSSIEPEKDGVIFVDYGKASYGALELTLTAEQEYDIGVVIGEDQRDGRVNPTPEGTVRYYSYPLHLKAGTHSYTITPLPDKRNTGSQAVLMPSYIGEVAPFRYMELVGYKGTPKAEELIRHTAIYPFDDDAAHFSSSDTTLNAIWDLCHYTIKATTALGYYIDGDRERIPYEADALINQLCHYTTDREYAMARRTSEYLLLHPTWPTEWILQALIIAWNDYMATGDLRSIEANYDLLKARTLLSLRRENGLISTKVDKKIRTPEFRKSINFNGNIRDIVDWPQPAEIDGHEMKLHYNSVVNAFHYRALVLLQKMATLTSRHDEAQELSLQVAELHERFNAAFYDPEKGAYLDGIGSSHHSLHSSMFALALGLTPEQEQERVMEHIRSRDMACSVYGSQFLLDATYDAQEEDYALHLLTKRDLRSWYNMLRCGTTITYEAWDTSFKPNQDWNHAWGAAPANIIPRRMLGIEPLEAGYSTISIAPQIATLSSVEGSIPTIRGNVEISIEQDEKSYTMSVTIPANCTARVWLPLVERADKIYCNSRRIKSHGEEGKMLYLGEYGSGEYHFSVVLR